MEAKTIRITGLRVHLIMRNHMKRIHFQCVSKTSKAITIFPKKL